MPEISVIIPAYNAENYIVESVKSVLNQTFHDLEVVVVDDGSTDDTASLVGRLDDPRIRLIQQENMGHSAAVNNGVNNSSGSYFKLMDADDWINPQHLEAQFNAISGTYNLLASGRWGYFVGDFRSPLARDEFTNKDYDSGLEWIVDSLTRDEGMMGGCMWLIPRRLWGKTGGFDPRLSLNNDFHFSIRLLLASEGVRFASNAVYSYRKGVSGALSGSAGRAAMESAYLTTELGTRLLLNCEDSPRIRKVCADRFQQWLFQFYPQYVDLTVRTEQRIKELGGSNLELQGGLLLRTLKPVLGWKGVRRLQTFIYKHGWQRVLEMKKKKRLERFN